MTPDESPAPIHQWTHEPLARDVRLSLERLAETESVRHVAVMPDVHLAEGICVGTVVATDAVILPQAIGGDIGCGMAVLALDAEAATSLDESRASRILNGLYEHVPVMRHRRRHAPRLPEALIGTELSAPDLQRFRDREAFLQFGTLGTGNHFLEIQKDEEDQLWLMVHSGSRGMGQSISAHHWPRARRSATGLLVMDVESSAGEAYLSDVAWAVRFAAANRQTMLMQSAQVLQRTLGVRPVESTCADCCHNYVRCEKHDGRTLLVHRKGAISASPGEFGIIPGSMCSASFHVTGRGHPLALRSSSHGAGRSMTRSDARRRISPRDLERQARDIWFDHRLASRLCEEAPEAYKDIHSVMRAQKELARAVRKLQPLLCYKGT